MGEDKTGMRGNATSCALACAIQRLVWGERLAIPTHREATLLELTRLHRRPNSGLLVLVEGLAAHAINRARLAHTAGPTTLHEE